ncbi:MAG: hypothetical protein AVDCRST_MAG28-1554, partial [uncultured Rubrobacteraceae bacterium]
CRPSRSVSHSSPRGWTRCCRQPLAKAPLYPLSKRSVEKRSKRSQHPSKRLTEQTSHTTQFIEKLWNA